MRLTRKEQQRSDTCRVAASASLLRSDTAQGRRLPLHCMVWSLRSLCCVASQLCAWLRLKLSTGLQGDKAPPSIKLPSFKDIQQNATKRSRLQTTFDGSRETGRPQAAAVPVAAPTPRPQLPPISATTHAAPAAAPRPVHAPAVQPARPAATVAALPQCGPDSHPQQLQQHQQRPQQQRAAHTAAQSSTAPTPVPQSGLSIANHSQTAYSSQVKQGNAILVNKNQQGNPVLKQLRNINYRFATIIPDYQFNDKVRLLDSFHLAHRRWVSVHVWPDIAARRPTRCEHRLC